MTKLHFDVCNKEKYLVVGGVVNDEDIVYQTTSMHKCINIATQEQIWQRMDPQEFYDIPHHVHTSGEYIFWAFPSPTDDLIVLGCYNTDTRTDLPTLKLELNETEFFDLDCTSPWLDLSDNMLMAVAIVSPNEITRNYTFVLFVLKVETKPNRVTLKKKIKLKLYSRRSRSSSKMFKFILDPTRTVLSIVHLQNWGKKHPGTNVLSISLKEHIYGDPVEMKKYPDIRTSVITAEFESYLE